MNLTRDRLHTIGHVGALGLALLITAALMLRVNAVKSQVRLAERQLTLVEVSLPASEAATAAAAVSQAFGLELPDRLGGRPRPARSGAGSRSAAARSACGSPTRGSTPRSRAVTAPASEGADQIAITAGMSAVRGDAIRIEAGCHGVGERFDPADVQSRRGEHVAHRLFGQRGRIHDHRIHTTRFCNNRDNWAVFSG